MQDRYRRIDEILLRCTAGPYIWVIRVDLAYPRHVRFTPDSDRIADMPGSSATCQSETLGRRLGWVPASEFVELGPPVHSPLMFAALMIGHHFSISAF